LRWYLELPWEPRLSGEVEAPLEASLDWRLPCRVRQMSLSTVGVPPVDFPNPPPHSQFSNSPAPFENLPLYLHIFSHLSPLVFHTHVLHSQRFSFFLSSGLIWHIVCGANWLPIWIFLHFLYCVCVSEVQLFYFSKPLMSRLERRCWLAGQKNLGVTQILALLCGRNKYLRKMVIRIAGYTTLMQPGTWCKVFFID